MEAIRASDLQRLAGEERIDVTLPARPIHTGRLHPTTQIVREICDAFVAMGFQIVEGPEVEWGPLQLREAEHTQGPPGPRHVEHPSGIDSKNQDGERNMLLRTHTSPMQVRVMEQTKPPVRVIVPGKCYRYEATDATHEWHFYQVEGLAVDDGITFADLKGTLFEFARRLFGPDRKGGGFRCDYFSLRGAGCRHVHRLLRLPGRGM